MDLSKLKPGDEIFILPNDIYAPQGLHVLTAIYPGLIHYTLPGHSDSLWTAYPEHVLDPKNLSKLEKIIYGIE